MLHDIWPEEPFPSPILFPQPIFCHICQRTCCTTGCDAAACLLPRVLQHGICPWVTGQRAVPQGLGVAAHQCVVTAAHAHPCESMAALKFPSWDKVVDIAHHIAPSRGEPCLLMRIAVAAAAHQVCENVIPTPLLCCDISVDPCLPSMQTRPAWWACGVRQC